MFATIGKMLLIAWTTFYNESEKRAVNNYTVVSLSNELNGSHVVLLRSIFFCQTGVVG